MKITFIIIPFVVLLTGILSAQSISDDNLSYINQKPPGLTPVKFAPDLISTSDEYEFGSAFTLKADKFYYAVKLDDDWNAEIRYTELQNGRWTKPVLLELNKKYSYNDPFLSKDENRLYFISNRALDGQGDKRNSDLWYIQKMGETWSEPRSAGESINSEKDEYYISISNNETIYYVSNVHTSEENKWDFDLYYAASANGKFTKPVRMGDSVNSEHFECDPFVSPDETYLIFCSSRPGGYGQGDLYISFKNDNNTWSKAINMGSILNTEHHEFCPFVTKDGNYFFYTSKGDIYWINAEIIDNFKSSTIN